MKKGSLIDLIFIVILGIALTILYEMNIHIKDVFLLIPLLICYFIGRYVTFFTFKQNK